jgi:hypothetical protein
MAYAATVRGRSDSRWRRIRATLKLSAVLGAALVDVAAIIGLALTLILGVRLSASAENWFLLAGAFWFAHGAVEDVTRGRASPGGTTYLDPSHDYVRSADPFGYWVLTAVKVALAGTLVVAALGRWFGFSNFFSS